MAEFEVIKADSHTVSCSGNGGDLGHPKVYLEIPPDKNEVVCPYCSRKFIID